MTAPAPLSGGWSTWSASARGAVARAQLPDVLLAVVVAVSTGFYLTLARSLWFSADDWAFLLRRGTVSEEVPGAGLGLWEPHNEHWSTGPILIYRALFAVFGLRHSLPYLGPVLLAHAAVVVLMYLLLVRFGVRRWIAFAVATLLAFNGAGAENTLWAFQIGFVGPIALGLLALWLFDRYDVARWPIWPTWVVLTMGLTFSSIGAVMVAFATAYALLRRGVRGAVLVGSVPTAVFAVWFAAAGRYSLDSTPHLGLTSTLRNLPPYVWTVLTYSWERVVGVAGAGAVVVLVLLAAAVVVRAPDRARRFAWAGLIAAFLLAAMIGTGRAAYGLEHSKASRYVYVFVALMAPMLAVLLDATAERVALPRWMSAAVGAIVLGLVVVNGGYLAIDHRDQRVALFGNLRERTLATAELAGAGGRFLHAYPEEQESPDITTDLLAAREVQERLPDVAVSPQSKLDTAVILQVEVTPGYLDLAGAPARFVDGFEGGADATSGCRDQIATSSRPTVRVDAGPDGGKVRITSNATSIQTRLQRGDVTSRAIEWPTVAHVEFDVGSTAPDAALLVTLNASGVVTVCQ